MKPQTQNTDHATHTHTHTHKKKKIKKKQKNKKQEYYNKFRAKLDVYGGQPECPRNREVKERFLMLVSNELYKLDSGDVSHANFDGFSRNSFETIWGDNENNPHSYCRGGYVRLALNRKTWLPDKTPDLLRHLFLPQSWDATKNESTNYYKLETGIIKQCKKKKNKKFFFWGLVATTKQKM